VKYDRLKKIQVRLLIKSLGLDRYRQEYLSGALRPQDYNRNSISSFCGPAWLRQYGYFATSQAVFWHVGDSCVQEGSEAYPAINGYRRIKRTGRDGDY
jgi:hypothetical protein